MTDSGDRSIASVLQSILRNIEHIVRSEIRLAKAEVRDEVDKAGQASEILVGGAVLGAYSIGLFLFFAGISSRWWLPPEWRRSLSV